MNKKFINVLLLLSVAGAGSTAFTSCKDTDDDLRVEWSQADADLQKKVDLLSQKLEDLKSACDDCSEECQKKIAELIEKLDKADGKIDSNADDIKELSKKITDALGKGMTADEVKQIFESYTLEYFKNLGLLTSDDIKDFITKEDIKDDLGQIAGLTSSVQSLTTNYSNLSNLVNTIKTDVDNIKENGTGTGTGLTKEEVNNLIDVALVTVKSDLGNLKQRVGDLEETVKKISQIETKLGTIETRLSTTEQKAIAAFNQAQTNKTTLETLEGLVATIQGQIGDVAGLGTLADEIRDLKTKYATLEGNISSVDQRLTTEVSRLDGRINSECSAIGQNISDLTRRVSANETAISTLQQEVAKITKLENRLNSLITNVLVQGTFNPLFGTFALPIGVQSNMLVNYYGLNENQTYEFPSVQTFATYDKKDKNPQITSDELRMLEASNYEHMTIANGAILMNSEDGNLGKVFVTINPNNINFEGQNMLLVNSLDQESKVELRNLRPSQELLTFGYGRGGGNNNGFYEADATLPADMEAINATSVKIHDNLKSSMKQILEDKRNNLRSNLMQLMKAVYDQLNGMLPAYAMKAGWTVDGTDYAVYSNYNIAATTFKPLSYGFLYGHGYEDLLPPIDPISDAILNLNPDDYKFDFSGIKVNINGGDATLDINIAPIKLEYNGSLTVTVTGDVKDNDGNKIGETTLTGAVSKDDMDAFLEQIEKQFNDKIGDWNESIQNAYKTSIDKLMDNVNEAVEDMLSQMEGQINDKIADMVTSIQDEVNGKVGSYIGKFNSFIDRYNSLASRINNIFANPNHYLQPTMLYNAGNGGLHFLSGNADAPTKFNKAGGDGIMLYATSYTGEIIAPAYKKMVACVNVIDNVTKQTAQGGNGQLINELKAINNAQYIAEVCRGDQRRFAIPTSSMKSGHTYEILYTAVDYLGVTSTARFYLTVVD